MKSLDQAVQADAFQRFTLDDLRAAAHRVERFFPSTAVRSLEIDGLKIDVKLETEGPTGAFKVRGGIEYLEWLRRRDGGIGSLVTASTGNHAIALAYLANRMGIVSPKVFVPLSASEEKVSTLEKLGAQVEIYGDTLDEAIRAAATEAFNSGSEYVPSYHPRIILGHATLGYEIFSSQAKAARIYFPIGLGAGISGILIARKLMAHAEVIGVVPRTCKAWIESLKKGHPVEVSPERSLADGLRIARPHNEIFKFVSANIDRLVEVSEDEIRDAREKFHAQSINADFTGSVSLAGCLSEGIYGDGAFIMACGNFRNHSYLANEHTVRGAS